MKRILAVALTALFFANTLAFSEDAEFKNVKLADAKGKEISAKLVFDDATKSVVIRVSKHDDVSIPYANIDKLSTEYTKKHRIGTGAALIPLLGTGSALVMLSKKKIDWFYIDYHDKDAKQLIVLQLEKKDVQKISEAAKAHTGQEVIDLGNAGKKKSRTASGL